MICHTFNEKITPCQNCCQNCINKNDTIQQDETETAKAILQILISQPISRAKIRKMLQKEYPLVEQVAINLILNKYIKEKIVPNFSGFWTEDYYCIKKHDLF